MRKYIFAALTLSLLLGCGESFPKEAEIYLASAREVLVEKGFCSDLQDCRKREILFYEGGNPWMPSPNMAFVNLYEVNNSELVAAIEQRLRETQKEIKGPPVKLTVFSNSHPQKKTIYREIVIQ